MSWNSQGGGPWKSPGRGPWGQGPSGPQPTADLEEIIRRVQEALGKLAPGGGSGKGGKGGGLGFRTIAFVALAAVIAWFALGSFYTVQPNEVGINMVLGRSTAKTAAGPLKKAFPQLEVIPQGSLDFDAAALKKGARH